MNNKERTVSVTLTPLQFEALQKLGDAEDCNNEVLMLRAVDMFIAAYDTSTTIKTSANKGQEAVIKLLISLTKIAGQILYFVTLPITTGPVQRRLNPEGIALHWHKSEEFSLDLLTPPELLVPQDAQVQSNDKR